MASTSRCPFCGESVPSDARTCPHCGGTNHQYVPGASRNSLLPETIPELKEYCAGKEIPLERLRFFIGEDYREPKAYGIYQAAPTRFIAYKNKADGTRSVRYDGPDEKYAVSELFAKLLETCEKNGILRIR